MYDPSPATDAADHDFDVAQSKREAQTADVVGRLSALEMAFERVSEKLGVALFRISVLENELDQFKPKKVG